MSAIAEFIQTAEELHSGLARLSAELQQGLPERLARFPRDPQQRQTMQEEQREILRRRTPEVTSWLNGLYARLTELDKALTEEEREGALEHHRAAIQPYFLQSPLIRRCVDKPLGYPGDYVTVEMLFGSEDQGVSTMARLISHYALHCGPSQAHRARPPWLLGHIRRREQELGRPLRVLSFACGPEHTLREHTALGGTGAYTLCDFDPAPLDYCRRQFDKLARLPRGGAPEPKIQYVQLSTYQLLRHREAVDKLHDPSGPMDVIVAAGILDYLKDNVIARFLDTMASMLAPGGLLLLTNLHEGHNPWRALMEYVCDWFVIHRTPSQFQVMCEGPPERRMSTLELTTDSTGTNLFWAGQRR
ncbi:class I SAM-dependent methyltransferase [Archangium violaceum]|uniref:class I SAM-dependent methyltransferase n=1 Tax=Archangium violaceum TaxID=83451 RepID=UPI00194E6483|nr:class I SAM-dependent methyltransferase [Archangium violaceum]QRN99611.1 class I SAM-dependent methyltransferase [Archangium violaceum]